MGLDMYLTKKIYIGANYDHNKITGTINLKKDGKKLPINLKKISYIIEEAGDWRKANHIHKWFVDNVQDSTDDCGYYDVSLSKLESLLETCKKVLTLETGEARAAILPTQSGFFFGSTEYGEYYMQDVKHTIDIIEEILKEKVESKHDKGKYYLPYYLNYHSSW